MRSMPALCIKNELKNIHLICPHLILFQAIVLHHFVSLLLESDDDKSHKDVDEEEGEDHEVHHVKDGHFHPVTWTRALILIGRIH